MSFLTPLYFLGLAAVALPILFHLIRRTPRGRVPFSTTMFLRPSAPRITSRRRVDDWLLLLLRGVALCLLAMAFARPFLRELQRSAQPQDEGRQVAILLDTSASMRRGLLWTDAVARAKAIVASADQADSLSLQTFDNSVTTVCSFEEWGALDEAARRELVSQRLESFEPGWAATDLGQALATVAASLLHVGRDRALVGGERPREIVVITDLQAGSRLAGLESYQWPEQVTVVVEQVATDASTNAGIQLVAESDDPTVDADHRFVRVRVTNAEDSVDEQFQIGWVEDADNGERLVEPARSQLQQVSATQPLPTAAPCVHTNVPRGQSRVVRVPVAPDATGHNTLRLVGDDHEFDNRAYLARPDAESLTVLYLGPDDPSDAEQPRYYLERAFPPSPRRTVRILAQEREAPLPNPSSGAMDLAVVVQSLTEPSTASLRNFASSGGTVVCVTQDVSQLATARQLLGDDTIEMHEADIDSYSMLSDVDLQHPVLAPFAEPRFSDFTKIHVWKHRIVNFGGLAAVRVLVRFDDGNPALAEVPLGSGRVFLFATSWRPRDSQWALSSKFVPLLNAILDYATGRSDGPRHFHVGDAIPIERGLSSQAVSTTIQLPDSSQVQLASTTDSFPNAVLPGIYTVANSGGTSRFSVNIDPAESRTAPLPVAALRAFGIPVREPGELATANRVEQQRQLQAQELEGRQKMWRWLIVAAIGILLCETWLAGRRARGAPVK